MRKFQKFRLKFSIAFLFLYLFISKANSQTLFLACNQSHTVIAEANTCKKLVRYKVDFYESFSASLTSLTYSFSGATTGSGTGTGSGSVFNVGTTNLFFTATLLDNSVLTCATSIIVKDTTAPIVNCGGNITIDNTPGFCGANILPLAKSFANCGGATLVATRSDGLSVNALYPIGNTTLTWTATNTSGVSSQCIQIITVLDKEKPVITCPPNKDIISTDGKCGAIVDYTLPTVVDKCVNLNSNKKVLLLKAYQDLDNPNSDTDKLKAVLESAGFIVTISDVPNGTYDGTNPSLNNFDAVVDVTSDRMTAAGQTALVDFVINKGKIFFSGGNYILGNYWDNSLPLMNDILPLDFNLNIATFFGTENILNPSQISSTYLAGIPSPFIGPNSAQLFTQLRHYTSNPAIPLIKTTFVDLLDPAVIDSTACAYAVREFSSGGRAFCINHLTDFNNTDIYTDINIQHLYINALSRNDTIAVVQTSGLPSGALFPEGVTTNTFTATDNSGNIGTCSFTVTVKDAQNPTNYIIYATKEAKFGENNIINGDVGVTAADGKAEFEKNDVLNPNFVKAKSISVHSPALVSNKFYVPATGGPAPTFFPYSGNTTGLSNFTVSSNSTLAGNYKDLTINNGLTVTLSGNNFGKIEIKEGANVTFTSSAINIIELQVKKGTPTKLTAVNFSNPTTISIKNKITVEENARLNEGGPKISFYLGDISGDAENFIVKGKNTRVTANIIIPKGKLKVEGSDEGCIMTGWYVIEKLESSGKNVQWNKYDCSGAQSFRNAPSSSFALNEDIFTKKIFADESTPEFKVEVYPNPSANDFKLNIESKSNEPVTIRIIDMRGKEINVIQNNKTKLNSLQIGARLIAGTYFVEISQGNNKQMVKLVKLK